MENFKNPDIERITVIEGPIIKDPCSLSEATIEVTMVVSYTTIVDGISKRISKRADVQEGEAMYHYNRREEEQQCSFFSFCVVG